MYQVWDGEVFLFLCDKNEADIYSDQGFTVVKAK